MGVPGVVLMASGEPPRPTGSRSTLRVDRSRLDAYLAAIRIVEDPIDREALIEARLDMEQYAWLHGRSSQLSLEMLGRYFAPGSRPRVLELGGAPYYFSAAMERWFDADLTAVNVEAGAWPGAPPTQSGGTVVLEVPEDGIGSRRLPIDVRVFNMEKDPFPFEDDAFDLVLCMEVLEHLAYSPSHMLAEAHRVLRADGIFFLTVPNFINIKRTVNMLLNRPTEFPYSGYGIYGRHQREYAPVEVKRLFEACHYRVVDLETANVWPTFRDNVVKGIGNAVLNGLSRLPLPWIEAKREYILCAAEPVGEPIVAYPAWLYEHRRMYPEGPSGIPKVLTD